jgi:hypothetical protein
MRNKLLIVLFCLYIIVCAITLVYYFPWTYTYEDLALTTFSIEAPIYTEHNETVRSPYWSEPEPIIKTLMTIEQGNLALQFRYIWAERNWERFFLELIILAAFGFLIYRAAVLIYYKRYYKRIRSDMQFPESIT